MVKQTGNKNGKNPKRPSLNLFFLNGDLHKKLRVNRGKDILVTWNYPKSRKETFSYTETLKRYEKGFTTKEVCAMIGRARLVLELALSNGDIPKPQFTYALNENRRMYQHIWSEKDIMGILDFLSTVHRGRPRKDGEITPGYLPTPRELRAMIHEEGATLYVKHGDQFIPSWRAKEF